ncbi:MULTISPECIES: tripartite tricarboxylate transporter substrate binding protein [unclassified Achromobacter]|uniref:Bug family tripartite tricarboxylate transporter substrate binding protein n=1 Tax=unclassified Achromobacter TaxID=2626865 RepID=UPI000B518399|nr:MULTISPECIES: tripartite tricarboxylate transporter substrate binding protein [unclassified Achromobacter]OWT77397.1 ABC transporter substrate-binding protein [Achromobacter sp. HZ28]OWT78278.1 ABC transporter substrate-binding protein [Achromobacter sp. HZ34]
MQWRVLAACLAAAALAPMAASADTYPSKPIRMIVPFPPGGTADIIARVVSDKMAQDLGVALIVENRPGGAGGGVGTMEIARAPADGYTIGIATVGTLGTAPATAPKALYDPAKDFSYISNVAAMPMLIAAGPSSGATSLAQFIELAKKSPGRLAFASGGTGGVAHLMGARFEVASGTKLTHIPYRGANPALNDVTGGQVDVIFDALASSWPYLQTGRIHALAVSGDHRIPALAQVPTFAEAGLPTVSTRAWYGLIGPAQMDPKTVDRLYAAVKKAVDSPEVRTRLGKLDTEAIGSTPDAYKKQVLEELDGWKQLATSQHIVAD